MKLNLSTLIDGATLGPEETRKILKTFGHDIGVCGFPTILLTTIGEATVPAHTQGARNRLSVSDVAGIVAGLDCRRLVRSASKVRAFARFVRDNARMLFNDEEFFIYLPTGEKTPRISRQLPDTIRPMILVGPGYTKKIVDAIFESRGYEI